MSNDICNEPPPEKGDVVVAIDVGTSRSAYSWTLVGNEDTQVEVEKAEGGTYCSFEVKVPTSVLIEGDNVGSTTVRAFGAEAEELYAMDPRDDLYLLRLFKMGLHRPFNDDPMIPSANGRRLPLSVVLKACLEHIKREAISRVRGKGVLQTGGAFDVTWVLTLPAIWSDWARHAMRRAAFNAGLISRVQSRRLVLALEPECAAIAFMANPNRPTDLERGDQLMIVDSGGGTLDITTHKIRTLSPLKLAEVLPPTGGALGATRIDENFFAFLKELLGGGRFEDLKVNHPGLFLDLTREWEGKKRIFRFDPATNRQVLLRFGDVLLELDIRTEFRELVSQWNANHSLYQLKAVGSSLMLPFSLMRHFFDEPVQAVVDKVAEVIDDHKQELNRLKHIVLAGGFSRCPLLQSKMLERFPNTVVGNNPDLLIVEGAAMFGARPQAVFQSRIARYTFGVETTTVYREDNAVHKKHVEHKYLAEDGQQRLCIFEIHGRKGDTLETDSHTPRQSYTPLTENQTRVRITVLVTESTDVFIRKDITISELGSISVSLDMSKPFGGERNVEVEFSFGDTEVKCHVYSMDGKHLGEVEIDFNRVF